MTAPTKEYHALWYHLGQYGRQDVHLHPRIDKDWTDDVLVGFGGDCDGGRHVPLKLTERCRWSKKDQEGQPLPGSRT